MPTPIGSAKSRMRRPAPGASAGRSRQAATNASGYSNTPSNRSGASRAVKAPPSAPPARHPEIELGQALGRRPQARQLAVADQRADEQAEQVQRQAQPERQGPGEQQDQRDEDERLGLDHPGVAQPRPAREGDDVGQEIQRERHHPEQRHCGQIGGDVGRHREQEAGRDQREHEPAQPARPADRLALLGAAGGRRVRAAEGAAPDDQTAARDRQGQGAVTRGPQPALLMQRQAWARPGADRTSSARTLPRLLAPYRKYGSPAAGCPLSANQRLDQRRGGGDRQNGRPTVHAIRAISHGIDIAPAGGSQPPPIATGRLSAGERQQAQVARDLPAWTEAAAEAVGVGIAGEQRALEEHHRGVPDGGRAAEQRQRHAREQRLDREHEERAEQHGAGEPRQGRFAAPRGGLDRKRPVAALRHPVEPCPPRRSVLEQAAIRPAETLKLLESVRPLLAPVAAQVTASG